MGAVLYIGRDVEDALVVYDYVLHRAGIQPTAGLVLLLQNGVAARNHKEIHEVARPQLVELDRDASIPRHAVSSGVTLVQDEVASTHPQRAP